MTPKYLSASGLKNYLTCPFKYQKAQIERLQLVVPKAFFSFGKAVHKGIEKRILEKLNPVTVFEEWWGAEKAVDLEYNKKESHDSLMGVGKNMLSVWEEDVTTQGLLQKPAKVETPLSAEIDGISLYGIVDYLSEDFVIDWKTASSEFGEEKKLDLQLPFYSLLLEAVGQNPDRTYGFGVLIKKKNPCVQYFFMTLKDMMMSEVKTLIHKAWEGIIRGDYPRIPNSSCSLCDYLPICLGKDTEGMYVSKDGGLNGY